MKILASALMLLGILLVVGSNVWFMRFKWGECKKVGHSTLYCFLNLGK